MVKLEFGGIQITSDRKNTKKLRPHIEFIKEQNQNNNKSLVGVEIGVLKGNNAYNIMKTLNIKNLYLVDPYEYYEGVDKEYPGIENIFNETKERFKEFGDRVTFIRKKSDEAINDIPDNIDFVYIDGNHDYEYAKSDIELYYNKLRKGGILSGHSNWAVRLKSVIRALLEFADKHNLDVDGREHDWWTIKK